MDAWDRLCSLFDTDDGALYDIRLTGLDERGVAAAFDFVRSHAAIAPDSVFWHKGLERDERVADHPDAATLVVRGVAEPFHVLACGLHFSGQALPDVGVFVWKDEVTLDYRPGSGWGRPQLFALFELLRQLAAATGGRVGLGKYEPPETDRRFVTELEAYCARRKSRS